MYHFEIFNILGLNAMTWNNTKNIVQMPPGSFRSIIGYAGESLAIGRALICGYNLFFKAWRDAKYDAVLDANGHLYRIEIKQTTTVTLSTSSGGRSGQQIDKTVASREAPISTIDCDFILGIQSLNGKCWIIPVEIVEILKRKNLALYFLDNFEEKWRIFTYSGTAISTEMINKGFSSLKHTEINKICKAIGLKAPPKPSIKIGKKTTITLTNREWKILNIWLSIYKKI